MTTKQIVYVFVVSAFFPFVSFSFSGCQTVRPIRDFVVEIATGTGEIIREKSKTLAEALNQGWKRVFGNVEEGTIKGSDEPGKITILDSKRLRGRYNGHLTLSASSPDGAAKVSVELTNPIVVRKSVSDMWCVHKEEYQDAFAGFGSP